MAPVLPTIILPVFNAIESFDACLASLQNTLPAGASVLISDDASTDPQIEPLARAWCRRSRLALRYVRREQPLGFPANCNAALADTGKDDVVILSCDAIVTPGWLGQLTRCAHSDARIATIMPWSNEADICSFPIICENNPAPAFPDVIAAAAAGLESSGYPDLPAAASLCLFIRRAALRVIGNFDADTFDSSHAVVNDLCRRALSMGWRHVLCQTAFIVRADKLFLHTQEDRGIGGENLQRLLTRWPDYHEAVARFILSDPIRPLRTRLAERISSIERSGPQHDLFF